MLVVSVIVLTGSRLRVIVGCCLFWLGCLIWFGFWLVVNSVVLVGFLFVLFSLVFGCLCVLFFGRALCLVLCMRFCGCFRFVVGFVYDSFFVAVFVTCLCCVVCWWLLYLLV